MTREHDDLNEGPLAKVKRHEWRQW